MSTKSFPFGTTVIFLKLYCTIVSNQPVRRRGRNSGDRVSSEEHSTDSDLVEIERELEERDAGSRAGAVRDGNEKSSEQRFHGEEKMVSGRDVRRLQPLSVTIPAATVSSGRGEEFGDGGSCCLLQLVVGG